MKTIVDRLRQHPDAPKWNHAAGDRLSPADRSALAKFGDALARERARREPGEVPEGVLRWLKGRADKSPHMRRALAGREPERDWDRIPTMSREDLAVRAHDIVPDDADLAAMLVYRTAGTTGHALLVPHAARAVGAYLPLLELGLRRHGVRPALSPRAAGLFLVGAQARTVTYPSSFSYWKGAGFAKLNLNPGDWPSAGSAGRYFAEFAPPLLTGDPLSFAEMLRQGVGHRPRAMVTTAVALSRGLKKRLEKAYRCPVVDWYSLTETGPLGYACPKGHGYHQLPHDVHLEALRPDGTPAASGERGEIAVTGGRNPYLPLLRYRTGDWGRLDYGRCPCGDPMPRLLELEGREPVVFRRADGSPVNPVDVSRVLREFPLVQHEMVQRRRGDVELTVRPLAGGFPLKRLRAALAALFGPDVPLRLRASLTLGSRRSGKAVPYRSELLEE